MRPSSHSWIRAACATWLAAGLFLGAVPGALAYETRVAPAPKTQPRNPKVLQEHQRTTSFQKPGGRLYVNRVKPTDVGQGAVGDCFFLAAASAVAQHHPNVIRDAFTHHDDGTLSVRLFQRKEGAGGQVKLEPKSVHIDRTAPLTKPGKETVYATTPPRRSNRKVEQWPMLLEKAFASTGKQGYRTINEGGFPGEALEVITGRPSTYVELNPKRTGNLFAKLKIASTEGRPMVASTWGPDHMKEQLRTTTPEVRAFLQKMKGGPFSERHGLMELHAYTVLGVSHEGKEQFVHLRNPWGYHEPSSRGFGKGPANQAGDGIFKLPINVFATLFQDVGIGGLSNANAPKVDRAATSAAVVERPAVRLPKRDPAPTNR